MPITDFFAYTTSSLTDSADAYVINLLVPDAWPYGIYTTCEDHTDQGGGSGEYRWCDEHMLVIDEGHPWVVSENIANSPAKQRYLACHELGHTTGLQHPANLHGSRVTCMDYDGHDTLHEHDEDHLNDCYPRPTPAPATRTPVCREFE